jgi:hypothetical protein
VFSSRWAILFISTKVEYFKVNDDIPNLSLAKLSENSVPANRGCVVGVQARRTGGP